MENKRTICSLLLLLTFLAGWVATRDGEFTDPAKSKPYGPLELTILGPDFVTVGVPCSYECFALCSPSCSYTLTMSGEGGPGNQLAFTMLQWVSSMTLNCTAHNNETKETSVIAKTVLVLEGPTNVSISGPELVVPGSKHNFLCHAACRPSCTYTWKFGSRWVGGHGNEITITAQKQSEVKTLICKAKNRVSGLYAMATRSINVADGPSDVHIEGPDVLTAGTEYTYLCSVKCLPGCVILWTVDGQMVEGSKLSFTAEERMKSANVVCEAQNIVSGEVASNTKTVSVKTHHLRSMATQTSELTSELLLLALTLVNVLKIVH